VRKPSDQSIASPSPEIVYTAGVSVAMSCPKHGFAGRLVFVPSPETMH
jgi:hypothetical protein